jgi:hypothetical protein
MSVSVSNEKVTVNYRQDRAIIRFSGDVNADRIFKLCDEIDFAINYYNYNCIQIDIDSPGGEAKSLKHYIHNLRSWRRKGVSIQTRALTNCCSAGAYMLSFGDIGHRTAMPHTMLLYHNARVSTGERSMTADHCDGLMWNLNATDFGMILMLLEHLHPEIPQPFYRVMAELLCCLSDEKHGINTELLESICTGKEKNALVKISKASSESEKLVLRRSLHGLICERLKKKGKVSKDELPEKLSEFSVMDSVDAEALHIWIFRKALWFQQDFTKDTYIRPETAIERSLIDKIEEGE